MICNWDRTSDNTDTNIHRSPHAWPQYVDKGLFYAGSCTDNPDRSSYHPHSSASETRPRGFRIPLDNLQERYRMKNGKLIFIQCLWERLK